MDDNRTPLEALEDDVRATAEIKEIILDWFAFDAAKRWMDGTLAAPDEDSDLSQ